MADDLQLTDIGVRQHLQSLETLGLAECQMLPAAGRGRPARLWSATELAARMFPDRHGELTVGLLDSIRSTLGVGGLEKVLRDRARRQAAQYRLLLAPHKTLKARVEALARQRSAEGYMAEVVVERPGQYLLLEHHCPICDAARSCIGLCGAELDVFRSALGEDVDVERTTHLLDGGDRCVYRVQKRR
jgi:predicted ArsR family transcriptional regulator